MSATRQAGRQAGFKPSSKASDACETPRWLYRALDAEFAFDLDPCPLRPDRDGLEIDWQGRRVFCNPPYSDIKPWVEKAIGSRALTVLLVPKRFNSLWSRMLADADCEVRLFARGIKFRTAGGRLAHPLGGSMVVIVRHLKYAGA